MELNYTEILKRIDILILNSGLSVYKFETETNLPTSSVIAWRKGRAKPSLESLTKICNFCNVSLEYLVFGTETNNNASLIEKPEYDVNDKQLADFIKLFNVMDDTQKAKTLGYIIGLLDASGINTKALLD